jgi:hypothetical protein
MGPLKTSLCLHAQSSDLKFLNPVRNRIAKLLGSQLKAYELTDRASHADAMLALKQAVEGFVVIFAHGSGDYLRGGEYRSRASGENIEIEKFLTREDLGAFNGKVVFCMSCDSNGLAQASIDAGAIAFVGFDKIPFNRFNAAEEPIGSHVLVKHCQEKLLAPAITATLERFVTGRATLDGAVDYLCLWITKNAVAYVREYKSVKERREVAALFLRVKQGIRYHGPSGIRFARNA